MGEIRQHRLERGARLHQRCELDEADALARREHHERAVLRNANAIGRFGVAAVGPERREARGNVRTERAREPRAHAVLAVAGIALAEALAHLAFEAIERVRELATRERV